MNEQTAIFTQAELQSAQAYFDRQAQRPRIRDNSNPLIDAEYKRRHQRMQAVWRNLSMLALIAEDSGSYDDQQELLAAMEAFGCDSIWKATEGVTA